MVFSHPCGRLKLFPSNISKQVALLNASLCLSDCGSFDAQTVKALSFPVSVRLPSALSHPPRLFQSLQISRFSSLSAVPIMWLASAALNPFYTSTQALLACILWLHFYQGSHCVPRSLGPILWDCRGFHWVQDAYSWPIHFSPYRPELVGGRTSAFCRMISVASGGTKLCNQRMNTSFKC